MQGLGDDEINMHKEIGLKIDSSKIDYVFTYGPLSNTYCRITAVLNFGKDKVYSF